jgi:hypothetical protein
MIRTLADGVDPTTGEVLERESTFQNPQIVRALFAAADALERRIKAENRTRYLPENAGSAWSQQEDEELSRHFDGGMGIADLAEKHKRTRGSISARLERLGKIPFRER